MRSRSADRMEESGGKPGSKNRKLLKAEQKRGGRPRKDLGKGDLDRVEHLASLGVAQKDITPYAEPARGVCFSYCR